MGMFQLMYGGIAPLKEIAPGFGQTIHAMPNLNGGYDIRGSSMELLASVNPTATGMVVQDNMGQSMATMSESVTGGTDMRDMGGELLSSTEVGFGGTEVLREADGTVLGHSSDSAFGTTFYDPTGATLATAGPDMNGMSITGTQLSEPQFEAPDFGDAIGGVGDLGGVDLGGLDALSALDFGGMDPGMFDVGSFDLGGMDFDFDF